MRFISIFLSDVVYEDSNCLIFSTNLIFGSFNTFIWAILDFLHFPRQPCTEYIETTAKICTFWFSTFDLRAPQLLKKAPGGGMAGVLINVGHQRPELVTNTWNGCRALHFCCFFYKYPTPPPTSPTAPPYHSAPPDSCEENILVFQK